MGVLEAAANGALGWILEIQINEARHNAVRAPLFHEVQGSPIVDEEVLVEHVQEGGIVLVLCFLETLLRLGTTLSLMLAL
jgi:hypothetical protein